MKLFTVSEPIPGDGLVRPGIRVFANESPMGLRWGSLTQTDMKILPLCRTQYRAVRGAVESALINADGACILVRADVVSGPKGLRLDIEKDERDQRAFIYVCTRTLAGDTARGGGQRGEGPDDAIPNTVVLTSNESNHVVDGAGPRDRVRWAHKPFSEAVGIERLDTALLTEDGATWNEVLLVLQPGASFRVVRGGDIRDLVPEFTVIWTGHRLRTAVHERYRPRLEGTALEDAR